MSSCRNIGAVTLGLLFVGALAATACGEDRSPFAGGGSFDQTNGNGADAGECLLQCSLDGRSVLRTCTGEVVETCPAELACGAGVCQEPCAAAIADRSSKGCEFYLQPPEYTRRRGRGCYAAFVVNDGTAPVELSLEFQGKSLDLSKSVFRTNPGDATLVPHTGPLPVGESAIVFVADRAPDAPASSQDVVCPEGVVAASGVSGLPEGTGVGSSFHLVGSSPITVATIYPFGGAAGFSPTATLLLPVGTWAKQHLIINAWERIMVNPLLADTGIGPAAQIVASEDDTDVTILPTRDIQSGNGVVGTGANVPVTYKLNKGEVLQFLQAEELTGSVVSSTKPTSTFGGHECMYVPSSRQACDTAQQQLLPFEQWGSEYVGAGYRPRLGNGSEQMAYRIVAARDDTRLDYDPAVPAGAPLTLSAGEVATFWAAVNAPFVVRTQDADHPVYLAAYMTGSGGPPLGGDPLGDTSTAGEGDPEFVNVIPAGQYMSSYSFYADPTYEDTSLVIVRAKSGGQFKDVWLECAGNLTSFQPVGTRGDYEWTRVDLARDGGPGDTFGSSVCRNGLQRMKSEGPFTATLWGWSRFASYAYPGGLALRKLVETPLPPIR